jgi:hypothetical protein
MPFYSTSNTKSPQIEVKKNKNKIIMKPFDKLALAREAMHAPTKTTTK